MPVLNIYKSPITDMNEPFESDLGGNTIGEEWPCREEGPEKKGSDYVVHECLGCWGAEEAKTERGREDFRKTELKNERDHSAVWLWRQTERWNERWDKKGERTGIDGTPHSLIPPLHQSPRSGDVKLLHQHSRKPLRGHSSLLVHSQAF